MFNFWTLERRLGRIRVENYSTHGRWRFNADAEENSWIIDLRDERKGPYGTTIASVKLRQLTPNIFLSEKLFVHEDYRRKGISEKLFHVEWAFVSSILGGSILMAFVTDSNHAQVQRLEKLGWIRGNQYTDEECFEAHVWFYSSFGFVSPK